jgi:hypothetical protein
MWDSVFRFSYDKKGRLTHLSRPFLWNKFPESGLLPDAYFILQYGLLISSFANVCPDSIFTVYSGLLAEERIPSQVACDSLDASWAVAIIK